MLKVIIKNIKIVTETNLLCMYKQKPKTREEQKW